MLFVDLDAQDIYSVLLEILPIQSINCLRMVNKHCAIEVASVRRDSNFWKRRLELLLGTQVSHSLRYTTWQHVYEFMCPSRYNLNQLLVKASKMNKIDIVTMLIGMGIDVTSNGNWAIQVASSEGNVEIVMLLISSGADVTADDNEAINTSSKNGHYEVVKVLITAGADVTSNDNKAVKSACIGGHTKIVKLLIEAGANSTSIAKMQFRKIL